MKKSHLESLRGLASLIVFLAHFAGIFYPFSLLGSGYKQVSSIENLFNQSPIGILVAGQFAVCIFFILSGYVLSYKYIGVKHVKIRIFSSAFKRPVRLGGLVLFTMILSYIFLLCNIYFNKEVALLTGSIPFFQDYWSLIPLPKDFIFDLILFPLKSQIYNPPLWTINSELIGSYIVYIYLFFLGSSRYRLPFLSFLIIFFRDSSYLGFLFGILFAEAEQIVTNHNVKFPNGLLVIFLSIGLFLGGYPYYSELSTINSSIFGFLPAHQNYPMIGAFMIFFSVQFFIPLQAFLKNKILLFIGQISYALYAIHFIVLGSISSFLYLKLLVPLGHNLASIVVFVVTMTFVVPCSYLVTKWVDQGFVRISNYIGSSCEEFLHNKLEYK